MLPHSLIKLGHDFHVNTIKSKFPHKFSTEVNLFYEGPTPPIEMYESIDSNEYQSLRAYI